MLVDPLERAELRYSCDFAVGVDGSIMWDREFLGAPASAVSIAFNQEELTIAAVRRRAIGYPGRS